MKLSKALKVKNRLVGEIAHLRQLVAQHNIVTDNNTAPVDVLGIRDESLQKQQQLMELKAKIAVANGPIWAKIVELGELKARIGFLRTIPVRVGTFTESQRYGAEPVKTVYRSKITQEEIEATVKLATERIDTLQDEIDQFNATTDI